jgi:nucleoside-diphosphate-sugar epimerase
MSANIYISGIRGFVGGNIEKHLQNQYRIKGVSRSRDYLNYDELSVSHLNNSHAFIHLAGKAHDLKNSSDSSEYFKVNTELTKKMYDVFLSSNCKIFIYMSSVKAVADSVSGKLIEDIIPAPKTAYGKSKLEAENYILQNLPKDREVFILRPCMIHGPGNKGNLNLLYSFVKKGVPFPLGKYNNQRSFLNIDNLNFVISEILQLNVKKGVYNVSDSETLSINQLVKAIGEANNNKTRVVKIPKWIMNLIAKAGDNFSFIPLNSEKLQKLTENYIVDNSKLLKALKKPLPITVTQGVIKTIKNFG